MIFTFTPVALPGTSLSSFAILGLAARLARFLEWPDVLAAAPDDILVVGRVRH